MASQIAACRYSKTVILLAVVGIANLEFLGFSYAEVLGSSTADALRCPSGAIYYTGNTPSGYVD